MAPKISIIVPAFNEEKYIGRCLDSILDQTFTDFEVLCVDDGSTDSTYEIIEEYSKKDSRIIPLKNTGKGVSSARNYGIEKSNGDYIGFVDSDDFIQPQMYEFLYRAIKENDCDISLCRFIRTNIINESKNYEYSCRKCSYNEFLIYENESSVIVSAIWNKLIKKDIIIKNNIKFKNYKYGEDTVFSSELLLLTNNLIFIDIPLYVYFSNFSSVSYVNYSDRKWMDKINTDYIVYYNFLKNNNIHAATFFISLNLIFLLSYRSELEVTEYYKSDLKTINETGKKYLKFYLKSDSFSFSKKIYVLISFYFPSLYKLYRKLRSK